MPFPFALSAEIRPQPPQQTPQMPPDHHILDTTDWDTFDRTIRSDAPSWDEVDPNGEEEWEEWEDTDPDGDPENA